MELRKHVLIVTFPTDDHFIPTLEFARRTSEFHDVTFAMSKAKLGPLLRQNNHFQTAYGDILFVSIDDGLTAKELNGNGIVNQRLDVSTEQFLKSAFQKNLQLDGSSSSAEQNLERDIQRHRKVDETSRRSHFEYPFGRISCVLSSIRCTVLPVQPFQLDLEAEIAAVRPARSQRSGLQIQQRHLSQQSSGRRQTVREQDVFRRRDHYQLNARTGDAYVVPHTTWRTQSGHNADGLCRTITAYRRFGLDQFS